MPFASRAHRDCSVSWETCAPMQAVDLSFTSWVPCSLALSPDSPGLSPSLPPSSFISRLLPLAGAGLLGCTFKGSADTSRARDQPGQGVGGESQCLSFQISPAVSSVQLRLRTATLMSLGKSENNQSCKINPLVALVGKSLPVMQETQI